MKNKKYYLSVFDVATPTRAQQQHARARAQPPICVISKPQKKTHTHTRTHTINKPKGVIVKPVIRATSWWVTPPGRATSVFLKMYVTILVGALFMRFYPPEYEAQHLSWVDALYFATVASTTVGYGDVVVQTKGGRMFMCVYMVIATGVVGSALQEMMAVYIEDIVGEKIVQTLIDSTTFVHSTDIDNTGVVTEADYVTFKLQQMQKVPVPVV